MNKTKIEWCDVSWNVVTGCLHDCDYCYARRIAERFSKKTGFEFDRKRPAIHEIYPEELCGDPYPWQFEPTFHRHRLNEPKRKTKPLKIFVSSMGDLFGDWVPDEWISEVMKTVAKAPQHTYMFLTKNPDRYFEYYEGAWQDIPEEYDFTKVKFMLGTTVTNQTDVNDLSEIAKNFLDFLSIEPLFGEIDLTEVLNHTPCCCEEPNLKWVIIGAQTGPGAVPPKAEWVQSIIDQCRAAGVSIFLKDNLKWPEKIQEFPKSMIENDWTLEEILKREG